MFSVALTPPGSGQSGISMASIRYCMSPEKMAGGSTPSDQKQKEANMFGQMIDMYCLGLIYFELCCPFSNDKKRYEVHSTTSLVPRPFREEGPGYEASCTVRTIIMNQLLYQLVCSIWSQVYDNGFTYTLRLARTWGTKYFLRCLSKTYPLRYVYSQQLLE